MKSLNQNLLKTMQVALSEDLAPEDITTQSILKKTQKKIITAKLIAKQNGVMAGRDAFKVGFAILGAKVKCVWKIKDGESFKKGQELLSLTGSAVAILAVERSALNLIQHLSGIASLTQQYVLALRGTKAILLDTRKTTPGLRDLEKYAVRMGGGTNHRMHLADAYLLKENHLAWAGGVRNAIACVRQSASKKILIIEVKNLAELKTALDLKVDRILLDNFSVLQLRRAVKMRNKFVKAARYCHLELDERSMIGEHHVWMSRQARHDILPQLEASGGVTLKTIRAIAKTGVDYISVGVITHSAPAIDLSLLLK